jgi:hypothetical protein
MLRHQDLYYVYDVDKLSLGGTYANENLLVRLLADSSIGGLWSARDDQQYCGKWRTDFYVDGQRVKPARTEFAPEYQRTRYASAGVTLTKTVFVPVFGERMDIVFVIVEAHNAGKEARTLGVSSDIRYPEFGWAEYSKFPDPFQRAESFPSRAALWSFRAPKAGTQKSGPLAGRLPLPKPIWTTNPPRWCSNRSSFSPMNP